MSSGGLSNYSLAGTEPPSITSLGNFPSPKFPKTSILPSGRLTHPGAPNPSPFPLEIELHSNLGLSEHRKKHIYTLETTVYIPN